MKKDITYVDGAQLEQLIVDAGLTPLTQAGFIKVAAAKGRAVYVARTKKVGRIDISGFLYAEAGVTALGGSSFGAVKQQVDFSRPEADILLTFKAILEHMKTLPAAEVKKKASPMARTKNSPKPVEASSPADRKDRLAHIKKIAAQMGVNVSPATMALADDSSK